MSALVVRQPAKGQKSKKKPISDLLRSLLSRALIRYILLNFLPPIDGVHLLKLNHTWQSDKIVRRMLTSALHIRKTILSIHRLRATPTQHTFTTPSGLTHNYQMPPPKRKGKKQRDREKARAAKKAASSS